MSTVRSPLLMTRLTQPYEVAEGATAFHFEKPAGWTFQAGQFLKIRLLNPVEADLESDTRAFSNSEWCCTKHPS